MPFTSWQTSLQKFFPFAGTQLQPGCAHFGDAFIAIPLKSPLKLALARYESVARTAVTFRSVLLKTCGSLSICC